MSVEDYVSGALFVATVKKNLATNPSDSWVNRYEFEATAAGGVTELTAVLDELLLFEQALHSAVVHFTQLSMSTWEPDSKPYDPTTFISKPVTAVGLRVVEADLEPLDKALSVSRVASSGRAGHLFFRGSLYETDVITPSGKSALASPGSIQDLVENAIISSELEIRLGAAPTASPHLVMVNKNGTQVRNILSLVVAGVASIKTDHMWYNRTSPTP